jgi:hypothetical protein
MGSGAGGPLSRPTTAYRTRPFFQQQQQTQQQRQHEYFKGFTFEGESVLESIKRQEDEQANTLRVQLPMTSDNVQVDDEVEEEFLGRTSRSAQALSYAQTSHRSNQPFSGQPESFDSIFGSS